MLNHTLANHAGTCMPPKQAGNDVGDALSPGFGLQ